MDSMIPGYIDAETGDARVFLQLSDRDRARHDRTGAFVACRVVGNCLAPRIEDGDVVVVDQDRSWAPGDLLVFRPVGARGQVKELVSHAAGELTLTSNEGTFTLRDADVAIIGRVVDRLRYPDGRCDGCGASEPGRRTFFLCAACRRERMARVPSP